MKLSEERKKIVGEYSKLRKRGASKSFLTESDDGFVEIPLKEENLFSAFNEGVPSSEALEYLRDSISAVLPIQKARIVVSPQTDVNSVRERFRDYLAFCINRTEKEKRRYAVLSLVFLMLGAAIILSSYFFAKYSNALVAETIDTIGCVLIWNAAEFWFIERRHYDKSQIADLRLYCLAWKQERK